jgi:hypothetical protein
MAKMACPSCGAQAKRAAGKPYCASCGWNVDEAKRVVLRQGIFSTVSMAIVTALVIAVFIHAKDFQTVAAVGSMAVLGLVTVICVLWIWPLMRLRKVEKRLGLAGEASATGGRTRMMISGREVVVDMPGPAMSATAIAVPSPLVGEAAVGSAEAKKEKARFSIGALGSKPDEHVQRYREWNEEKGADAKKFAQKGEAEAEFKRVATMPVPRAAKFRLRIMLRKLAVALILMTYFVAEPLIRVFQRQGTWETILKLLGFVGVEVGLVALAWLRYAGKYWQHKRLVSEGAVAMGRVTGQRMVGNKASEITYVFEDGRGIAVVGKGPDLVRAYFEKMWVVVFYDAAAPEKNVTQAGSMYEVG